MRRKVLLMAFLLCNVATVLAQSSYVTRSDLAISTDSRLAYGVGPDGVLNEIRISDGTIQKRFDLNIYDPVYGIGINKYDSMLGLGTRSGRIIVFDLTQQKEVAEYRLSSSNIYEVKIFGDRLIASGRVGPIYEADLLSGELIREYEKGDTSNEGLSLSTDGRYLLAGNHNGTIQYFNRSTGAKEFELLNPFINKTNGCNDLISAKISPSGKLGAVTGCGGRAIVLDLERGEILKSFQADPNFSTDVSFSADSKHIAVSNLEGSLKVFDVESGQELFGMSGLESDGLQFFVSYTPDGKQILSSGPYFPLRIFSAGEGNLVHRIPDLQQ